MKRYIVTIECDTLCEAYPFRRFHTHLVRANSAIEAKLIAIEYSGYEEDFLQSGKCTVRLLPEIKEGEAILLGESQYSQSAINFN